MDGSRFDGLTRTLANGIGRRKTLQGVAGGALGGLLVHLGLEEASAACLKVGQQGCKGPKNKKCCKDRYVICQGGSKTKTGKCVCKGSRTDCGGKCVNTQTSAQNCGVCFQPCEAGHSCQGGTCKCAVGDCVSGLGCRAGDGICNGDDNVVPCPGSTRPSCRCITDVESIPRCSDLTGPAVICQACERNSDCEAGRVCIDASSSNCFCPDTGTVGTGCARENCFGEE